MYERGSVFKLKCKNPPKVEILWELQRKGIGIRRGEGFGQILFMKDTAFEQLTKKEKQQSSKNQHPSEDGIFHCEKVAWVMENGVSLELETEFPLRPRDSVEERQTPLDEQGKGEG
jgi:hypothetical protein